MYSLLIVDDEPLIRRGISKILNWRELGVDRIFEAGDGREALDVVRNNQIDLVLTDIVMPFMDGIALAKELHSEFPKIQVVIATGHEDFEYARQSVDLGVCSYILKPMGAKTLFAKMSEIITGIRKQDEQQQYFNKMRAQLHSHMPIVQERYLNEIVCMKHGDKEQLVRQGTSVGLDFSSKQYIVAVLNLELDSIPDEDIPLYMFSCKNIAHDCVGNHHNIFAPNSYKKLVILFHCDVLGDEPRDIAYQTMEVILKALDLTIHVKATGGIGTLAEGVGQLSSSYYAARRACEFRFSLGNNVVYDIGDRMLQPGVFNYPAEDVRVLLRAIRFKDREAICEAVHEVRRYIQNEEKMSGINVRIVLSEIVTDILKDISEMPGVSSGMISQCMQLYSEISQMSSLDEMMDQIQHAALTVSEEYHKAERTSSRALILRVKECVEKNYSDVEFSLGKAAEAVSVSTGYLSALFKKETGTNFVKYLTDVRMQKAMELLQQTDKRAYEIAEAIGFDNTHYFSVSFKKYTGMSPSEFRNRQQGGGGQDGDRRKLADHRECACIS